MAYSDDHLLRPNPDAIRIKREIAHSEASSIFEIDLQGLKCVMKLFHNNGDPGYTKKGRDLNRFRCELNAYRNLHKYGVCARGFVPQFHGSLDQIDPAAFEPFLRCFAADKFKPQAIFIEYLPNPEPLNCVNYSDARFDLIINGIKEIHAAHVKHQDAYPKNILIVPSDQERVVWVDFDVATTFKTFGAAEKQSCKDEYEVFASFRDLLRQDQKEGLPPNTKYY
ncbi:hypothetical protein ASPZODRAFT_71794 [Penicilliopsis zonata CBS 506.65]|uniref:Protein kinase domain-containing protein n=1 Tax=Penicilliopsis zonata CBS 506.65 TaxID=1073090 RepID=A0A1L9SAN0_9EURO|nr:hypothetical protein ASPZODRAFT_71794 [Penicilliopsis zonata CBS 506.65]OJJ44208.1 hypothetical protein ASPZODRAFT_71794 [Penicilliopsis zonata CBS 506.65]